MGGLGSGNRHRFDKKTTTGECNDLDVRKLYRDGPAYSVQKPKNAGTLVPAARPRIAFIHRPSER